MLLFPQGMEGRIRRAINQRLFVLGHHKKNANTDVFKVSGSTGNVYDVTIGPKLSCSCVDYRFRRVHCKHLLMVMLKVCHISPESNMYSSLTVKPADLAAIDHLHASNLESRVPEELQTAVDKYLRGEIDEMPSAPRRPLDDGECPVCYESFDPATYEAMTVSCRVCGNNIHTECFRLWESSTGGNATCVFCRAPWNAPTAKAKLAKNHEGFVNVGQLLDLPEKRDYREYLPQTD
ncbi:hypothetical protein BC940DRAFT_76521 [Gongronella butleri]|nr:hypothetical protein BC940DRAFT_76521 [Gongronella butleri]